MKAINLGIHDMGSAIAGWHITTNTGGGFVHGQTMFEQETPYKALWIAQVLCMGKVKGAKPRVSTLRGGAKDSWLYRFKYISYMQSLLSLAEVFWLL